MKTRDHIDGLGVLAVVDGVWEAPEESSAKPYGDLRKRVGKVRDQVEDTFQSLDELITKAWTLGVVPFLGQHHVRRRLRPEADDHG